MEEFTVLVRGNKFTLSQEQVQFDMPNYFSMLFLGDFVESESRTVQLDRNPDLFHIVLDYLSGYEVLPLEQGSVPRMGVQAATKSLLKDAEFYMLSGLVARLRAILAPPPPDISHILARLTLFGVRPVCVEMEDLARGILPPGVAVTQTGLSDGAGPVLIVARDIPVIWEMMNVGGGQSTVARVKPSFPHPQVVQSTFLDNTPANWTWSNAGHQRRELPGGVLVGGSAHVEINGVLVTGPHFDYALSRITRGSTPALPDEDTVRAGMRDMYNALAEVCTALVIRNGLPTQQLWGKLICFTIDYSRTQVLYADLQTRRAAASFLAGL